MWTLVATWPWSCRAAGLGGGRTVVLGLPRGGVPVAAEVGVALGAPLDVIVVRKLGVPFQPELAMGAIGEDGVRVENEEIVGSSGVDAVDLEAIEQRERAELDRRAQRYREGRPGSTCRVAAPSSWTTGSPPARRHAPPAGSPTRSARRG